MLYLKLNDPTLSFLKRSTNEIEHFRSTTIIQSSALKMSNFLWNRLRRQDTANPPQESPPSASHSFPNGLTGIQDTGLE
jgi:hypothetical protein